MQEYKTFPETYLGVSPKHIICCSYYGLDTFLQQRLPVGFLTVYYAAKKVRRLVVKKLSRHGQCTKPGGGVRDGGERQVEYARSGFAARRSSVQPLSFLPSFLPSSSHSLSALFPHDMDISSFISVYFLLCNNFDRGHTKFSKLASRRGRLSYRHHQSQH